MTADPLLARTRGAAGAARAAFAAAVALALLVAVATPSHAASVRVAAPDSGATVDGPTTVRAQVDAEPVEEIEWVEARLRRNGSIVGSPVRLSHQGGDRRGGTSTWSAGWDPAAGWVSGGGQLANGTYRVEARANASLTIGEETTGWSGNQVTVSLPPATPRLQAASGGHDEPVELRWSEATAPDFTRYRVERAADGGSFQTIAEVSERGSTSHRDEPGAGTWRYRVTTARSDGAGGERTASSDPVTVELVEPEPTPTPTPDGSPSPTPSPSPTSTPTGDDDADDGDDGAAGDTGEDDGDGDGGDGGDGDEPGLDEDGDAPEPSQERSDVPSLSGDDAPDRNRSGQRAESGEFSQELPYDLDELEDPDAAEPDDRGEPDDDRSRRDVAAAGEPESDVLTVAGRQLAIEEVLTPIAGGLLLFVTGGHLLRLRSEYF